MAEIQDTLTVDSNALDLFDKIMNRIDKTLERLNALNNATSAIGNGASSISNLTNQLNSVSTVSDQTAGGISSLNSGVNSLLASNQQYVATANAMINSTSDQLSNINALSSGNQQYASTANTMINSTGKQLSNINALSSSNQKYASVANNVNNATNKQTQSMNKLSSGIGFIKSVIDGATGHVKGFINSFKTNPIQAVSTEVSRLVENASSGFGTVKRKILELPSTTQGWQMSLMGIKAAIDIVKMGINSIKGFIGFSDNLTQTTARLNIVNDGLYTTNEIMRNIANSALRSGGDIDVMAQSVASLRANAKDVFTTMDDAIAFNENLSKIFTFSGTDSTGAESVMYNLTQALSTGVLRGQDFNTVLSNAPAIIDYMAQYMGLPIGKMREMAEAGELTADLVKNALMSATDDINSKFDEIPMTFARAFNMIKTEGTMAFLTVNESINNLVASDSFTSFIGIVIGGFQTLAYIVSDFVVPTIQSGLDFINQHLEQIKIALAVLTGVVAVFGAIAFASFVIAHLPLILVIMAVVALIDMFTEAGGTAESVFSFVGGLIGGLGATAFNIFATIYNVIATVAEFLYNVFVDPIGSIKKLFADMAVTVLDILSTIAGTVDKILGTDYSTGINNLSSKVQEWGKEQVGDDYKEIEKLEMKDVKQSISQGQQIGEDLSNKLNGFNIDQTLNSINTSSSLGLGNDIPNIDKVGSVGKIDEDITISDEDLKLLKDVRQQNILIGITTPTPVTFNNYGDSYGEDAGLINTFLETMKDGEADITVQ